MELRPATPADLPALRAMFTALVAAMNESGLTIWDDVYPVCMLEGDVAAGQLFLLTEGDGPLAAFTLCPAHEGASAVSWPRSGASACYLDRLGVHPRHARQGLGSHMLAHARALARARGFDALRLFVVEENRPAVRLYEKNGFVRAGGVYAEVIDESLTLRELGYESPV